MLGITCFSVAVLGTTASAEEVNEGTIGETSGSIEKSEGVKKSGSKQGIEAQSLLGEKTDFVTILGDSSVEDASFPTVRAGVQLLQPEDLTGYMGEEEDKVIMGQAIAKMKDSGFTNAQLLDKWNNRTTALMHIGKSETTGERYAFFTDSNKTMWLAQPVTINAKEYVYFEQLKQQSSSDKPDHLLYKVVYSGTLSDGSPFTYPYTFYIPKDLFEEGVPGTGGSGSEESGSGNETGGETEGNGSEESGSGNESEGSVEGNENGGTESGGEEVPSPTEVEEEKPEKPEELPGKNDSNKGSDGAELPKTGNEIDGQGVMYATVLGMLGASTIYYSYKKNSGEQLK